MTSPQDPGPWQRPDDSGGRPASASLVDPEDDLPAAHYGGDFETTAIPRYDASKPASEHPFGLMSDPDPLPYVQPSAGLAPGAYGASAAPTEVGVHDADRRFDGERRGTQDLGLLLLRVAVGVLLIGHGLQKVFGLWGGPGLGGFRDSLNEWGFQHADILTYVAAGGQIAAGVLLVLGLFTPIAAAGALAYLVTALLVEVATARDEARLSDFLTDGHQYQLILVCAVAAIVLIGPGRYGLDAGRGWSRRPFVGSFAALILGVGAGVAIWVFLNGANPLA